MLKKNLFRKRLHKTFSKGFSLVELMIALIIISILAIVMLRGFSTWSTAHKIEADTDALFSFLQDARLLAFSEKRTLTIVPNNKTLELREGANVISTLTVESVLTPNLANINLSNRGIVQTSRIEVGAHPSRIQSSYNCIDLAFSRIRRGKMNDTTAVPGTTCENK